MTASSARRTKIIATLGPASSSASAIGALVQAGLDVVRLNFSHGAHDEHLTRIQEVRRVEREYGKPIGILQDLCGPKIRLGAVEGEVELIAGATVRLSSRDDFSGSAERLPTSYSALARDVRVGERILLADGRVALRAEAVAGEDVVATVEIGGRVSARKGLNLPESRLSVPALTDKDITDLRFGLEHGVDFVALSFVRSAEDIGRIRREMAARGRVVPVIAKIEKPEAVDHLEEIVDAADGIMVARGDLGVELPPERVPTVQREAIACARRKGKLSVVATQMLMSMTERPRPTHAEVSDVANAVFDGADAVMLSEETAVGAHPARAVAVMADVAAAASSERIYLDLPEMEAEVRGWSAYAVAKSAAVLAGERKARAIAAFTQRGLGPRLMAALRPDCVVLGLGASEDELRRMSLYWGVVPTRIPTPESLEALIESTEAAAAATGVARTGDTIVITSKIPFVPGQATNTLKLHTVGAPGPT